MKNIFSEKLKNFSNNIIKYIFILVSVIYILFLIFYILINLLEEIVEYHKVIEKPIYYTATL